ncbi:hypothetical protein EZV62_010290 [Acer yangbiense]|uniref:Uncharacterized protein n=1 Tax=Acer yangbiense TaxID=1000413 RepID=A0A5C7I3Z9_9ROSI|nr:hypothetical protein EZV62_010290 [Acer yangbiense]
MCTTTTAPASSVSAPRVESARSWSPTITPQPGTVLEEVTLVKDADLAAVKAVIAEKAIFILLRTCLANSRTSRINTCLLAFPNPHGMNYPKQLECPLQLLIKRHFTTSFQSSWEVK